MDVEYLVRLIHEYNPPPTKKPSLPQFRRDLYFEVEKWIDKKQAIAIVGLRRTGKTTIMRQFMEALGCDCAFFSFDEEETQNKKTLVFILDYFVNNLRPRFIFLDEVQYVPDWEGVLKRYYDTMGLKFMVSGSESLQIDRANAAMAGRMISFKLGPMSFREYLSLKGKALDNPAVEISDFEDVKRLYTKHLTEKEFYENEFLEYVYKGAFPELVQEAEESTILKYTYDLTVKKIIYRDIPSIFEVRRKDLLNELFRYACANTANLFDVKNLSNIMKANQETVNNYLTYLKSAFLIKTSESYSRSISKRMRRNKKLYVTHPSLAFAALGWGRNMLVEKVLGQYVESALSGRLFWRDERKNEVDAVIIDDEGPIPLEVKYKSQIITSDLSGVIRFMEKHNVGKGLVATKNTFEERKVDGRIILLAPAWLLMLCSRQDT